MSNYKFQKIIVVVGILLFILKFIAWYFTQSVAILTDTLESIVNIISAFIGLYSLYLSALPKDQNHPYGHGKVEFLSAAIEGSLIGITGFIIIYEAILTLNHPKQITQLDKGIYLVAFTALINYLLGAYALKLGKKTNSLALKASGKHLKSDTYSTIGLVIGLIIMYFTKNNWLDSLIALLFAAIIIYTGYKILRESISGIMDETDEKLVKKLAALLQQHRKNDWIDIHNLRIIKYGGNYHIDCHVTLPYYYSVQESHNIIEHVDELIRKQTNQDIESFIHIDPCTPLSCEICQKNDCSFRVNTFKRPIIWNTKNISTNTKHNLATEKL